MRETIDGGFCDVVDVMLIFCSHRILPRRANVLKITPDGQDIAVCDKFGDVYWQALSLNRSYSDQALITLH